MTTMLTEPLFGSISILLMVSAFAIWVLLSALINKILGYRLFKQGSETCGIKAQTRISLR